MLFLPNLSSLGLGASYKVSPDVNHKVEPKLKVKALVPSHLVNQIASATKRKTLSPYETLPALQRAQVSVINAFIHSPNEFLVQYKILGVVGYGGNGCVLAAQEVTASEDASRLPVAIKIIYKPTIGTKSQAYPREITALRDLNRLCASTAILRCLSTWQDSHHFYLVTELFGSDWTAGEAQKPPLVFQTISNGSLPATVTHTLPFSQGAVDLWSWQLAHRRYMQQTRRISLLPMEPIKHILRECATALLEIHNAGFYHGDVKLENILLEFPGSAFGNVNKPDYPLLMLADYGHAERVEKGIRRYGTEEVSPPEFLRDSPFTSGELDGRCSDVFALGVVLYVLLSEKGQFPRSVNLAPRGKGSVSYLELVEEAGGKFPFNFDSSFSEGCKDLLEGMCRVDPTRRFDLRQVLGHVWLNGNEA
ncbi:hypothetical protein HDU98_008075 [Podochytrium sp. JEL0797]|nr:hypothetical protein HDU98_008075 [Podochytrium sp. JEL0797]